MTHADLMTILDPLLAYVLMAAVTIAIALVTGLWGKVKAWLVAHHQAALASAIASAGSVIRPALMTGASAIAAKIAAGQIDVTDKAAIAAEAQREVGLVEARVPQMIAVAQPVAGALVASMVSMVNDKVAPSAAAATDAPDVATGIAAAADTINRAKAAIASVVPPALAA